MKRFIFATFLVGYLASHSASAQHTRMVELQPIQKVGHRYFYDSRPLGTAFALQIPLQSLKDEEIDQRYNRFVNFQRLRSLGYLASLIYIGTNPNLYTSSNSFATILLASIAADITFNLISHHQMRKAIDRYNLLILPNAPIGSSPSGSALQFSLGVGRRFK